MTPAGDGLHAAIARRGMSRRSFLSLCAATAATLALPAAYAPRIAAAVTAARRIPTVWITGQGCGGDTEAFLRSSQPAIGELLFDLLSIDYLDALMVAAGSNADLSLTEALERHPNGYLAVLEGAVPTGGNGAFCTIGGRPVADVVRAVSAGAAMTIAVGSCASDGGLAAAGGGATGAIGAASLVPAGRLVSLPGCPVNADNLSATIVHWLTFGQPPATDGRGRPLFAYGGLVHNQCERRAHFEFGEFALAWGDEASQKGWCLYKLGCKGPETYANCPTVRYADRTSWPVRAGHGCIGCTSPGFWDEMTPFYRRLPPPIPFLPGVTADQVGQALVGGVGALTVVHGAASYVRERRKGPDARPRGDRGGEEILVPVDEGALPGESLESPTTEMDDGLAAVDLPTPAIEPTPETVEPETPTAQPAPAAIETTDPAAPEAAEPAGAVVDEREPADQEGDR